MSIPKRGVEMDKLRKIYKSITPHNSRAKGGINLENTKAAQ